MLGVCFKEEEEVLSLVTYRQVRIAMVEEAAAAWNMKDSLICCERGWDVWERVVTAFIRVDWW